MSAVFKVGDVCIWQNCVDAWAYLNGSETTITGGMEPGFDFITREYCSGYVTDTPDPVLGYGFLLGSPFELRLKNPPTTGETTITELFKKAPAPEMAEA